jgi:HEAT repeat protein
MINLRIGLASAFNIRQGEGLALGLLFTTPFFKGLTILFFETTANTKFLSDFGVDLLPHVYIATAVISVCLGVVYAKFEESIEPLALMKGVLILLAAVMVALYASMLVTEAEWLSMALMIWKDVHWILIEIEYWAVAGFLFNVRQGKRLFGLAATGDILSNILGGFGMPVIVGFTGTINLLLVACVGVSLCFVMLIITEQTLGHRFNVEEEEEQEAERSLVELCRERLLSLFFLLSLLSIVSYFLLDFIFYEQVESVYQDEAALAGFFGIFFAVLSLVDLVTSGLVTGRLLTRYGVLVGLVAAPAVALLGTISALAFFALFSSVGLFFWILIITKLFHEVSSESVEAPTFRILYQPLRPSTRLRAQTLRESIIEPSAIGLSGLLLLLLTSVWSLDTVQLSYVLMVFVCLAVITAFFVRREYVNALTIAVGRRQLPKDFLMVEDASSLEVLKSRLTSNLPIEVITSLQMLENAEHPSLDDDLIKMLNHLDPRVRKYALERIEARSIGEAASRIADMIEMEPDSVVRGAATRTLCALWEIKAIDIASPLLDSSDSNVRKGAMVGLLRSGGLDGVLLAVSRLTGLLKSRAPEERRLAADVLGEVGITSFYRPLLDLMNDDNAEVRGAALIAAGKLRNVKLTASIIACLKDPALRENASSALIEFGDTALPELTACLDREDVNDTEHVRLIRIMGRIATEASTKQLLTRLSVPNSKVRFVLLNELAVNNYQVRGDGSASIREEIRREAESTTWVLAGLEDLRQLEGIDLMASALEQEARNGRERVLILLSFVFPSRAILDAKEKLISDHEDMQAKGLEIVDNLVPRDLKTITLPLLDNLPARQQLAQLKGYFPQEHLSRQARLREIMTNTSLLAWTRACAVYSVGKTQDEELLDTVESLIDDPDALVRETAAWVLSVMDPHRLARFAEGLKGDLSPAVRGLITACLQDHGVSRQIPDRGDKRTDHKETR